MVTIARGTDTGGALWTPTQPTGRTVAFGINGLASLIPSLIHLRAPTSIGVYRRSLSRQVDACGQPCTAILNPEKRKVTARTMMCQVSAS
jgi:hypothetical protein